MRGARPVALVLALTTLGACADEARIEAKDAWIAEAPPGAQVLAAYVQLHNRSGEPLRCDGVYGAEFGAAEIHRTLIEDGRSRMLRGQTIEAPAGGSAELAPGGLHLMLFRPQRELPAGARTTLVLDCGDRRPAIEFVVRPRA